MRVHRAHSMMLMLVGSLALLPAQLFAGEPVKSSCEPTAVRKVHIPEGLKPDKSVTLSHQKPEMLKPSASASSWGEEHSIAIDNRQNSGQPGAGSRRVDPYQIKLNNYNAGTKVTVSKELAPEAIAMPKEERIDVKSAAFRKQVNADYNRDLAKAVATARKVAPVAETTSAGPSSSQQTVIEKPESLATKAHLVVQATDSFGRKYPVAKTQVQGLAEDVKVTREAGYVQNGQFVSSPNNGAARGWADRVFTDRKSGQLAPVEPLYLQRGNLRETPVFEEVQAPREYTRQERLTMAKEGKAFEAPTKESFVKLLSLAAFPRSGDAIIKVTNVRLEGEGKPSTFEFKQNGTGSGAIKVPARLGDKLRVSVIDNPAVGGNRSAAATVTTEIEIPRGGKGGVEYLPIDKPASAAPAAK